MNCGLYFSPDPWADPKSRSTVGLCDLHGRSTGVPIWGASYSTDKSETSGPGTLEREDFRRILLGTEGDLSLIPHGAEARGGRLPIRPRSTPIGFQNP